jgi:beta-lactamase superfamily II metal-dependent hydrolase
MTLSLADNEVLIRMYNVGFGDCFLLAFPAFDRPRKILIDCGTHSAGQGPVPIGQIAARVVTDSTEDDGTARIDIVVATHRHQDHVSGFNDRIWREVTVSEVWMPWTEHPTDPEARRVRERQSQIARSLCLALEAAQGEQAEEGQQAALALAANSLTNAAAMETLHRGFNGTPLRRFLPTEQDETSLAVEALPGLVTHVLGPSRDPEVIRDMDPPAGAGYLQFIQGERGDGPPPRPFRERWTIAPERFLGTAALEHLRLTEPQMQYINDLSEVDHFQIAVALEKAVNGTSLMLAFELGEAVLLFPGDAQWGTWNAALRNERWRELLARTTFYKVGHHGSHNATPREYVEQLLWTRRPKPEGFVDNFSAAVSTRRMHMWKYIPKQELIAAINKTTPSFARSDVRDTPVPGFEFIDEIVAETRVPILPGQRIRGKYAEEEPKPHGR